MAAVIGFVLSSPFIFMTILAIRELAAQPPTTTKPSIRTPNSRFLGFGESATAWFLGLMFVCGGFSKLMPFPGFMGPVWLEERLAAYDLGMFARFIAWSEAVIGLLLLFRKTRLIGAIAMVPLLVNILMVTISLKWQGTPWIVMTFLAANSYLLAFHFRQWQPLLQSNVGFARANKLEARSLTPYLCIALMLFGPLIFIGSSTMAAIVMSGGLLGLLSFEILTRFQPTD